MTSSRPRAGRSTSPRTAAAGIRGYARTRRGLEAGTRVDGIPVTTLERTLLDYAAVVPGRRPTGVLDVVERSGRLRPERLITMVTAVGGHAGAHAVKRQLAQRAEGAPWTQSELERRFLELVRDAGLPAPRTNVLLDGVLAEFYWPDAELVVEVDRFRFHRSRGQFERDGHNDTVRALAGRTTIRPTYRRIISDRAGLQADLSRLLAGGRSGRSGP